MTDIAPLLNIQSTVEITAQIDPAMTAIVTGVWPIGVTGQVTATVKGTLTAQSVVPVTALISGAGYGLGGVTAHGTITAQPVSPVTALVSGAGYGLGGVTAHGTITAQPVSPVTALISGAGYGLGGVTAHGQVTAGGTVTAEVKGTLTAESKGTITAEVKGTLTAEVQGALTAQGSWGAEFVASGLSAAGSGSAWGPLSRNYAYVVARSSGNQVSADLMASLDLSKWMKVTGFALDTAATATAQLSGYWPYVIGQASWVSASNAGTGTLWVQYAGGL